MVSVRGIVRREVSKATSVEEDVGDGVVAFAFCICMCVGLWWLFVGMAFFFRHVLFFCVVLL
jgi:hypothetical protein